MKNKMKTIWTGILSVVTLTATLAIGIIAGPPDAGAQLDTSVIFGDGTNTLPASTKSVIWTNPAALYLVRYSRNVAITSQFALVGAGVSNVQFGIDTGMGTLGSDVWITNAYVVNVPAAGTARASWSTNLDLAAVPFLRFNYISNGNTVAMTNLFLKVTSKRGL